MIGSLAGWGFVLSPILFCLSYLLDSRLLGGFAVICILPFSVAVVAAFVLQLIRLPSEIRRR